MIRLSHILVPTDFSATSDAALRYGVELARAFHARPHLLHVPEHPSEAAKAEYPIGLFETAQKVAAERLGHLLTEQETRELRPECALRSGTPYNEIVRYADERQIDLIVIGTHGRSGVARVLIGSVAEKVVRKAPCPVLTVHNPEHEFVMPDESDGQAGKGHDIGRDGTFRTAVHACRPSNGRADVRPDYGKQRAAAS